MKFAAIALLSSSVIAKPLEDWVESLPYMNDGKPFPYNVWSGYVDIDGTTKRNHYLFLES